MEIIGKRLEKIIEYERLSISRFASLINVSQQRVSHLKRSEKLSSDIINRVLTAFPDLRMEWLLFGEGSMTKEQHDNNSVSFHIGKELTDFLEKIGESIPQAIQTVLEEIAGVALKDKERIIEQKDKIIAEKERYIQLLEANISTTRGTRHKNGQAQARIKRITTETEQKQ